MKVILTKKELKSYESIMVDVASSAKKNIEAEISLIKEKLTTGNGIVKVRPLLTGGVLIAISEEYLIEFMKVYGRYANILVAQGIGLYQTLIAMQSDLEGVVSKHVNKEEVTQ